MPLHCYSVSNADYNRITSNLNQTLYLFRPWPCSISLVAKRNVRVRDCGYCKKLLDIDIVLEALFIFL